MLLSLILILMGMIDPVFAQDSNTSLKSTAVAIPGGEGAIGFDDLVYSSALHKVLVPAGHTGKLFLIDPVTFKMTSIGGFSSSTGIKNGQRQGTSSADEGAGFIFAVDHGKNELNMVDPKSGKIVAASNLAGAPDYVRYTGINDEVWVTEPHNKQLEVFKFSGGENPMVVATLVIPVPDGPETLVIDQLRGRAYTNLGPTAAAIDLKSHAIVATWPNECTKSRGDAIDVQRGLLFVSCAEGKAVVFNLTNGYKALSNLATDPGADVISYNSKLSHLYFTSSENATLSVIAVLAHGKLSLRSKAQADKRAHCVVSDDQNNIWVCDPPNGQLLRYKDSL